MIKPDTIAKIKDEADVVEVLGDFISMKKAGSNYKANCPFHNEKTPSFVISPAKGIYKCFGCGKAGNSLTFVMEHENLSYVEALKYLAHKYNIEIEEEVQTEFQKQLQSEKDSLFIVNEFAKDTYVKNLLETDEGKSIGLSYFKERGFNEAIIEKFQLGYSLEKGSAFTSLALNKGYQLDNLKKAGLTSRKENSKYDFFRGRVMFPIHSISGKVLGFGGRILKDDKKQAKYVNTSDSDIYNKSKVLYGMHFSRNEIRKKEEVFLVEGYTDVISLFQSGIENVVASSGTSLTIDQVRLIKRYTENIVLLFDGDNAGIKAALRGVNIILENGLNVKVVLLPENQDPDSYVREVGATAFEEFVKTNKKDFILFKLNLLLKDAEDDPIKKANLIQDIVQSISIIPDAIVRSVYIKECSNLLGVSELVLSTELNKKRKKGKLDKRKEQEREERKEGRASQKQGQFQEAGEKLVLTEEIVEAGINIEHFERNVIRVIIEHGFRKYDEKILAIDYIIDKLIGFEFSNELYQKAYAIAKDLKKSNQILSENFFANLEDQTISNLAITLMTSPYSESENWFKKFKIPIANVELTFKKDIDTELYYLNFWKIKEAEIQIMEKMKDKSIPEESLMKLLKIKQKLNEKKVALAKEKGTTITNN
jgi:DNA primase